MQHSSAVRVPLGHPIPRVTFLVMLLIGCAQGPTQSAERVEAPAAPASAPAAQSRDGQLIIKFRASSNVNPARADVLAGLSHDAGAKLAYVRPMSGDAHVLRVEGLAEPQDLARVIERLSRRTDVEYVEQDVRMYHQKKQYK
jgi:hypothetical protein